MHLITCVYFVHITNTKLREKKKVLTILLVFHSGVNFSVKANNGIGEELESMTVESTSVNQSGGTGPSPPMSIDLEHHEDSVSLRNPSPTQQMLETTSMTSVPGPWLWTSSYAYL